MARVIIFPTDTVYGIATPIFDIDGINKIYDIKKRPHNKPLACLCANLEQIEEIAEVNELAEKLIKKFLPGPLTLILNSTKKVKKIIGYDTIGVRIPNNSLCLDILLENGPMLTTSVNDSGYSPLNEYDEIVNKYFDRVDKIYPSSTKSSNISSTVIMLNDCGIQLIREGEIKFSELNDFINSV
ncbi:MAG: L-threonylcarbamoyladenylate synthase [Anaeroplasma sp.]